MNKIDDAWLVLQKLSPREQEIAAEAILDFASQADATVLSEEQAAEVARRQKDRSEPTITSAELRSRLFRP